MPDIGDGSRWNTKDVASVAISYGRDDVGGYQCPHCRAVSLIKQFGYAVTKKYVEDREKNKEGPWFNRVRVCVLEHEKWREGHQEWEGVRD